MGAELLPLLMFLALFLLLALGVPIAFSLGMVGIGFSLFLWGFDSTSLLSSAAWSTMNGYTLIPIPIFVFLASVLEKSGIIRDLYDTVYKWSGGLRGGLAITTVIVGTIIAAVSGVIAAGVIGLGLIAYPQMIKYNYQKKMSLGVVMAGGTLGSIIPPSINMVVYGSITGVSVGSLFAGGIVAGLLLAFLFCTYILVRAYLNKDLLPALPKEGRPSWLEKFISLKTIIAPIILIILMLGAILSGLATPTEGASVGAFGALVITFASKRMNWTILKQIMIDTIKLSTMVGWILIGAAFFGSVFSGIGGNRLVMEIASSMPGGRWGVLALSIVFIIFLGMFLDTTAIIMLAAPIISPVIASYGFDPLWWGLLFMVLLQMAFLTPPFGFAIYYLKSCVPKDTTINEIFSATLPFLALQFTCVMLILFIPEIVLWFPRLLGS
jgi:tripartite ATP-independent transporter DctM subunit